MSESNWAEIHRPEKSWRTKLIGGLSCSYVMPRYADLFEKYFKRPGKGSFLELGSGNGEMAQLIAQRNYDFVGKYVVSENFPEGVAWLKEKGFEAVLSDAEKIPFPDESFDAVISFDVMHHVNHPEKMAHEMLRTARGRLFLTESNGLSLGRKLMELTPGHRKAGEKSYTPKRYRSFFEHPGFCINRFEIHPFIFPLRLSSRFLKQEIRFNRWIERAPFLRWQSSNVYIYVEYGRT